MKKSFLVVILTIITFLSFGQHLKGYSIGHLFHPFPNYKINQEGIDLFDQLAPDVMRFPGGSIANKYHFNNVGYGWEKPSKNLTENFIVEYVRVIKAMKNPPKTVFVMNLLDHFKGANEADLIKENMDALQYLIDNGMDVIAVELGNEFYLYNEIVGIPGITVNPELNNIDDIENGDSNNNSSVTHPKESILIKWLRTLTGKPSGQNKSKQIFGNAPTASSQSPNNANFVKFERLAKIYADKIHAVDPSIKTGIPLGNFQNQKHTEYNTFVLNHFDFVDAYVVHFYGSFNKNCKEGDLACVKKGMDWSINTLMIPRLKYIKENTNKEIWVTEWNAIKFGHWGDEQSWARNTSVHLEYIKKYIDIFDQYGVTISTFHKLAGPMENAAYNAIDVDNGKCYPTPVFDVLKKYY